MFASSENSGSTRTISWRLGQRHVKVLLLLVHLDAMVHGAGLGLEPQRQRELEEHDVVVDRLRPRMVTFASLVFSSQR